MLTYARALCLVVLSVPFCDVAFAQRDLILETGNQRRALVIGNNSYAKGRLDNAVNDARLMGDTLSSLNFQVNLVTDAGFHQMEEAVDRFASSLSPGDIALFYYAGHGVQIDGENYLIPVDFTGSDEADIRYGSRSASWVLDKIAHAGARLQIVVLDACRTDPFRTTRSVGGGLAQMQGGRGSFIAFATAAGSIANDNPSAGNGLFTSHLVEALNQPGLSLDGVFNRVRVEVNRESAGKQLPFIYSGVIGEFYFRPAATSAAALPPTSAAALPASSAPLDAELIYWSSMKDSRDAALFESYLKRYPAGQFIEIAQARLAELRSALRAPTPSEIDQATLAELRSAARPATKIPAAIPAPARPSQTTAKANTKQVRPPAPSETTEEATMTDGLTFLWHHDHGHYRGPVGKLHIEKNLITWKEDLTQKSATSDHSFSATCSELKWNRVVFKYATGNSATSAIDFFVKGQRVRLMGGEQHQEFLNALQNYCSY